jgi:actin-like ATPase involved in cell morphogenesis
MAIAKLFTYFSALGMRTGTATATAGAATLNAESGVVTSEAITTAAAASYTLTITNSKIKATDMVFASVAYGTSTTGEPAINRITPADGSLVIIVRNEAAAAALNGTIKVAFAAFKA